MKERGILLSAPMVRALLEGRKSQTRRVLRPGQRVEVDRQGYPFVAVRHSCGWERRVVPCPYGQPGDRLWVRETWAGWPNADGSVTVAYRASCNNDEFDLVESDGALARVEVVRWRPAIHMPRWASRITLELTDVRVQRAQDISQEDAMAEGVERGDVVTGGAWRRYTATGPSCEGPRESFRSLWDSINGERQGYSWADNPWVWALSFRRVAP